MTRSIWNRVVAGLFDKKKGQVREQSRRRRLGLEWLEMRLAPATDIWTGLGGVNNAWSNNANWSRNGFAIAPQQGDDLIFDARTTNRNTNNDLAAGFSINSITISASNYTLGGASASALGSRITLGATGIHVSTGQTNEKLALDIQLGDASIPVTTYNFTIDDGAAATVTGHISGFSNATLAKNGTGNGVLTLSQDNTVVNNALGAALNAAIDIRNGTIALTNSRALGTTVGSTTVRANAQLQLAATGLSVNEFLTLNGRGINSDGALLNAVGNNAWVGTVSMDSDSDIGANGGTVLTMGGLITDTGAGHSVSKDGAGQVIFAERNGGGANTYRGQTIVNNGILTIQDPLSLGAGATYLTTQSGTAGAGTVVNYNNATGNAGTLQLQFTSLPAGDLNGIRQNPLAAYNAVTNPYVGFQVFNDLITLNGPGFNGMGALSTSAGFNGWDGDVILGGGVPNNGAASVGAATGAQLTISGVVKDPTQAGSPAGSLTKFLPGRVILNNNNTYTGTTVVAAGSLQIADSHALGSNNTVTGSVTVLNNAALELAVDSNLDGTAGRSHNRNLGFDSVDKSGTAATPGPVQEIFFLPGGTPAALSGYYYLTFKGQTTRMLQYNETAASLQQALSNLSTIGAGNVSVTHAGNLFRVTFLNGLANQNQPLMLFASYNGSTVVINPVYGLKVNKMLSIRGNGPAGQGALLNVSGINTYTGNIALVDPDTTFPVQLPGPAGIGVASDGRAGHPLADSTYLTNDYSLTVTGVISGPQLAIFTKDGTGNLILPVANTYVGPTNVTAGWITVQNSNALNSHITFLADTLQPAVTVANGAAVHFQALPGSTGLSVANNFILSGLGISPVTNSNYSMITQEGALLNIGGLTTLSGTVALNGTVGIGATDLNRVQGVNNAQSELTFTGQISDAVGSTGGITKLGNTRVSLQGPGTYTGAVDVREGILRLQNDTALGDKTSGTSSGNASSSTTATTVEAGARIEFANTVPSNNGGLQAGTQTRDESLFLNGQAQQMQISGGNGTFQLSFNGATTGNLAYNVPANKSPADTMSASPVDSIQNALNNLSTIKGVGGSVTVTQSGNIFTVVFGGSLASANNPTLVAVNPVTMLPLATSPETDSSLAVTVTNIVSTLGILSGDNNWTGAMSLNANTTFDVGANSRLSLGGVIDDLSNASSTGSVLTKTGTGELVLSGANTYRGTTYVNAGTVTIANGQALGAPGTNQAVENLSLTGSFNFTLSYNGATTTPSSGIFSNPSGNPATVATNIQNALNALPTISALGGVSVTRGPLGNSFIITFSGAGFAGQTVPLITATIVSSFDGMANDSATVTSVTSGTGGTVVANKAQLQIRGNLNVAAEALTVQGTGPGAPNLIPVQWFAAGPGPINNSQTAGNQASSGRVTGVAADPSDSNVIYVSTAGGGAWKSINGGQTWTQMFDGVSAVQTVTVTGVPGSTFSLTYGTGTTGQIPYNASAQQVQDALNALTSIIGADNNGSVTVTLATIGNQNIYTITFSGGSLANTAVPALTAAGTGGATATVAVVPTGAGSPYALFTGAIAVAPSDPRVIYLGTGEANNAGDSYYGTGVYKSTDSGRTWSLLVNVNGSSNPLYGLAVNKIVIDRTDPNLIYVATSNDGTFNVPADAGTAIPGIWRFTDVGTSPNSWFNMTAYVSIDRTNLKGQQSAPPLNAGPEDDFRLVFPQTRANWTDVSLVYFDSSKVNPGFNPTVPILYAALGGSVGDNANSNVPSNAVYRTEDPKSDTPIWLVGTPGANQSEIQKLTLGDAPPVNPGKFQISFRGAQSGFITFSDLTNPNGIAAQLQAALDSLSTVGPGNSTVTVTSSTLNQIVFTITFTGNLKNSPQPLIQIVGLQGTGVTATVSETQAGGGADSETSSEFPSGAFTGPAPEPPFMPRNGTIKFSTFVSPNPNPFLNPTFNQVSIYAAITVPTGGQNPFRFDGLWYPNTYGQFEEIQVSQDGGQTWKAIATNPPNYMGTTPNAQGDYDTAILITSPLHAFVAGVYNNGTKGYVYETTDGGATAWQDISVDGSGNGPHSDAHALTLSKNGDVLLGTDGGIWSLNTGTHAWTDLNGNLNTVQLNGVAQDPNNANIILGSAQDNGASITTGNLAWKHTDNGDGGEIAFDPKNSLIAYHVQNGILRRSIDGGNTWSDVKVVNGQYFPIVTDQLNASRLLIASGNFGDLEESTNIDNTSITPTFTNIGANLPIISFNPLLRMPVTAIAIAQYQGSLAPNGSYQFDPAFPLVGDRGASTYDPDTIYVTDGFRVAVTKDHGQSWVLRNPSDATVDPVQTLGGSIQSITVDPRNRDTAYLVVGDVNKSGNGRVYKTTTAGRSVNGNNGWTDITGDLTDLFSTKLIIDPRTGSLYIGNDNGVWTLPQGTTNGTTTHWVRFGAGLPRVQVTDLKLNLSLNVMTIATYGRGAFQLYLDETQAGSGGVHVQSGSSTWTGPVVFTGTTTINVDGNQNLPSGTTGAVLNIFGTISDATPGANFAFTKAGQGTLVLSGSNTYGGVTNLTEGIILVNNPNALGSFDTTKTGVIAQGGTVVSPGASLEMESDLLGEPVQLMGDGVSPGLNDHNTGSLRNVAGNNTYTGPLSFATATTIGVDSGTQLTIGTLNGQTGTITGAASSGLTKELTGTLVLASANPNFLGATQVNQGAVQVQNSQSLGAGTAATMVLDGAQMQIQGGTTVSPLTVAQDLVLSGTGIFGTGALLNTGGTNTWSGKVTLASLPNFSPFTTPAGSVYIGTVNAADTLTLSGQVTETAGEPSGLTKIGAGRVILSNQDNTVAGMNNYSGSTNVLQGVLEIQNGNDLGTRNTIADVQRITTLSATQVGNFTVSFVGPNGQFSRTFKYGDSAATVQNGDGSVANPDGLNGLLIQAGYNNTPGDPLQLQVTVQSPKTAIQTTNHNGLVPINVAANNGYIYTVVFQGTLATTQQEFTVSGTNGTIAGESVVGIGGAGVLVNQGTELDLHAVAGAITTPTGLELNLAGGTLHNLSGTSDGTPNAWGGQVDTTLASTITVDGISTLAFPVGVVGSGTTLTKAGTGSLQIDGVFTDPFVFALNGGYISGTGSTGTITGGGGTIDPGDNSAGNDIGTLTTGTTGFGNSGNVVLTANDRVFVDLGDASQAPGTASDLLMVNGSINLGGAVLDGKLIGGMPHSPNDVYTIIKTDFNGGANPTDTVTGQFAGMSTTPFEAGAAYATLTNINGTEFQVDYFADHVDIIQVNNSTATVLTSSANPSVYGNAVTFTATVTYTGGNVPVGNVVFSDGATVLGSGTYQGNGVWTYTTSTLATAPGGMHHSITAAYTSTNSPTLPGSTSSAVDQVVNQDTTKTVINSTPNPSSIGQAVTLTATVTVQTGVSTPTGSVTFYDGGTAISAAITANTNGVYSYTTSFTSSGPHTLTAVYSGDNNESGSTSTGRVQTVNTQQPTSTSVTSDHNPSTTGQLVTFTATVTDTGSVAGTPGGNVEFFENYGAGNQIDLGAGAAQGNGVWTFQTAGLAAGTHNITAVYGGDANFFTSTSAVFVQTVNNPTGSHGTSTNLSSSNTMPTVGQAVTFTATVTATPAFAATPGGNVEFFEGATKLGNGTATGNGVWTFQTSFATTGNHVVYAVYDGDANFSTSTSNSVTENVQANGSVMSNTAQVVSSQNPSVVGQAVTFSVSVTGTGGAVINNGGVTFYDGVTPIGAGTYVPATGTWNLTYTFNTAATHPITAKFAGNSTYAPSDDTATPLNQQVNAIGNIASNTSKVVSSLNPSLVGQAVTFSVSVTGSAGTVSSGTVTFYDGATAIGTGTTNGNGTWTFTTSALSVGNHNITARFGGNNIYAPSNDNATPLVQTVRAAGKSNTTTTLTSSNTHPPLNDQSTVFTATVSGTGQSSPPGGYVAFYSTYFANGRYYKGFVGYGVYQGNGVWTFNPTTNGINGPNPGFWSPAGAVYTFSAHYYGDANYNLSDSNSIAETVGGGGGGRG